MQCKLSWTGKKVADVTWGCCAGAASAQDPFAPAAQRPSHNRSRSAPGPAHQTSQQQQQQQQRPAAAVLQHQHAASFSSAPSLPVVRIRLSAQKRL